MNHKTTFIDEIIKRRIAPIIGMYIAAVWLAVEMADWMSNKFNVLPKLSSYVFVGLLTLIPSLIILAWGHGRPGKDKWTILEKIWIPLNIILAIIAINILLTSHQENNKQTQPSQALKQSAMQKKENKLEDKQLNTQKTLSEVALNKYNRVLSFFWDNTSKDPSLDWLSYASTWLFIYDIRRTPSISATTPYNSKSMIKQLQNKGFESATNIPLSLAIQVAKKSSKKWFTMGSFVKSKDAFQCTVKLYKTEDGKIVKTIHIKNKNMLAALDEASSQISSFLLSKEKTDGNIIPDLAISDHVSNNLAAIKSLISAKNAIAFGNDYDEAIHQIKQALKLDKYFVAAHVLAARTYQALGDYPQAIKHIDQALAKDYKLYEEDVYELKASKFSMQGKRDKAGLVEESWVRAFPNSPLAHGYLAGYYLYSSNKLKEGEKELNIIRELDPDNQNVLINLGRIYRIQENKSKTLEVLGLYLQQYPEKAEAYMQMGEALEQFGYYKKAIQLYEQASILGTNNFKAEISHALAFMQMNNYQKAHEEIEELWQRCSTDAEKFAVLRAQLVLYQTTGQMQKALETVELITQPAKNTLDPFNFMFMIADFKILILNEQGKYQEALKYAQALRDNSKPPFDKFVGIFFLVTYGNQEAKEKYRKEFSRFEKFLSSYKNPYWNSFLPALKSRVLAWDGKKQQAIELLENSIQTIKQSISGLDSLDKINEIEFYKILILIEQSKNQQALILLDGILERDPTFAKAYYLKAKIYKHEKQELLFQQAYDNALKIWHYADENLVILKKLKQLKQQSKSIISN